MQKRQKIAKAQMRIEKYTVPKANMGDWYHGQVPPTRISPMIDRCDNTNTFCFFPTILPPGQSISPSRFPVEPRLFPFPPFL